MRLDEINEAKLVGDVDHDPEVHKFGPGVVVKVHHNRDNVEIVMTGKGGSIYLTPDEWQKFIGGATSKKIGNITEASDDRKFYVSGFQNKKGRYRITKITRDSKGVYDISMGNNGVTYNPDGGSKLKFSDNTAKPMTAEWIFNHMTK